MSKKAKDETEVDESVVVGAGGHGRLAITVPPGSATVRVETRRGETAWGGLRTIDLDLDVEGVERAIGLLARTLALTSAAKARQEEWDALHKAAERAKQQP